MITAVSSIPFRPCDVYGKERKNKVASAMTML
jgi:hypothetical protein